MFIESLEGRQMFSATVGTQTAPPPTHTTQPTATVELEHEQMQSLSTRRADLFNALCAAVNQLDENAARVISKIGQ